MNTNEIKSLAQKIDALRELAQEITAQGQGIPALERNVGRILASVKMLELSVSDLADL